MPFEINLENENGKFHVRLVRNPSKEQVFELATLATNIIHDIRQSLPILPSEDRVYGPHNYQNRADNGSMRSKLGEQTITLDNWNKNQWVGSYKEPSSGCRILMLSFPPREGRTAIVKKLRELTNMTIVGAKHIMYGDFPCPLLTREVADAIMVVLREHNVHAKIIIQE
jgi:hypothetical protein